jgi:peptidoglycan/LPS O-acetylase OafA/YrhL
VAYRHYSGALRPSVGAAVALLMPLMLVLPLLVAPGDPHGQLSWVTAQIAAYACFGAAYLLRARPVHSIPRYLGRISYSLYLMHPIVLETIPPLSSPALTLLVWLLAAMLLAAATYHWIERPMIAWGRRLTHTAGSAGQSAETSRP